MRKYSAVLLVVGLVASVASADFTTAVDSTFNSSVGVPSGWSTSGTTALAWDSICLKASGYGTPGDLIGINMTTLSVNDAKKVRVSFTAKANAGTVKSTYEGVYVNGAKQVSVEMLADGAVGYGTSNASLGSFNSVASFASYATISVEMDFNTKLASVSVTDGTNSYSSSTFAIAGLPAQGDTFTLGAAYTADYNDYKWQANYIKNVKMEYTVPEPASLMLVGVGGVLAAIRRRK